MVDASVIPRITMDSVARLTEARKERGLTPPALANAAGVHVTQICSYEAATSAPTLDVQAMVRQIVEAVVLKHQAERWAS